MRYEFIAAHEGEEITLDLRRGNEDLSITTTPTYLEQINKVGLGVGLVKSATLSFPWYIAIWKGFEIDSIIVV